MIGRDGTRVSLWQDHTAPYKTKNEIKKDGKYDVIIVGGGITGTSTALLLQKAGKNVLLIEANTLCYGTTGGTTAHLNTLLDTPYTTIIKNFGKDNAELVAQSVKEAIEEIGNNINKYRIDCGFQDVSAYLFSQTKEQTEELEDIGMACLAVNLDIDYVTSIPLAIPFQKALEIKGQAKFHPVRYVYGLARAFEEAGGTIAQHCRVMAAENNEPIEVQTELGKFQTERLIYATHIPPGVSLLDARCAPYRTYAMAFTLANRAYPEDLVYDMYDPYHYYRMQLIDGKKYMIVGGEDHKTAHEKNTEACMRRLESHIRNHFEVDRILYQWSSQYFDPVDGLPYIGHMPGQPGGILVATGFGGNGMVYSSVAAQVLKHIILEKGSKYIDLYDPNRIKPIAGFQNFIKENVDVLKNWIGKFGSSEELNELAGLSPGEGRIVKYEDHTLALYKDEKGNLHALNPVCTHMKCHVAWNNAEKSWDCPCHGARYDIDGKVLTGPADHDLERIALPDGRPIKLEPNGKRDTFRGTKPDDK